MKVEPTQFNNVGMVLKSPWKFQNHGQSGIPVSELFPNVGGVRRRPLHRPLHGVDFSEHTNANYFLHTGHGQQGRPSMGSWLTYGLGSECRDLPGFIVLGSGMIPPGGRDNRSAPASCRPTTGSASSSAARSPVDDLADAGEDGRRHSRTAS